MNERHLLMFVCMGKQRIIDHECICVHDCVVFGEGRR